MSWFLTSVLGAAGKIPQVEQPSGQFWTQPEWWSFGVALVALGFSAYPVLRRALRRGRLEVDVHRRFRLSHAIGFPTMSLFLTLRNTGARRVRLKSAALQVHRRGDATTVTLQCWEYFEKVSDSSTALFVPVDIEPDATWSHACLLSKTVDRQSERRLREANVLLKRDLDAKRAPLPEDERKNVIGGAELVAVYTEIFDREFIWEEAEYDFSLEVAYDDVRYTEHFQFTIFDAEATELKAIREEYKHGMPMFYPTERQSALFLPLYSR